MADRIQKLLAQQGVASRRKIEQWISEGRILVNGQVAELGQRLQGHEQVKLNGRVIKLKSTNAAQLPQLLLYNKPEGEICSRDDPEGRPTVFSQLPKLVKGRWVMVGRLDINTQGLLLFTDNGELANRLMHPRWQIPREYAVRVRGEVDKAMQARLLQGVTLDDGLAKFEQIRFAGGEQSNQWYHVVLNEGRNREVRRLWESQGVQVSRLIRVRYGTVNLPRRLSPGQHQLLAEPEVQPLLEQVKWADPQA